MRNDANLHARSPRGGRGSFLPSSFRAISTYLRSVSANASSIASSVRSAAVSPASTGSSHEEERQREQVQWAGFDTLEVGSETRHVLLLTYLNGFQVWDVEEARNVRELVSRRDGQVAFLRLQPRPYPQESQDVESPLIGTHPLLLVVTGEALPHSPGGFAGGYNAGGIGSQPGGGSPHFIPTSIRFYSLKTHNYVHTLRFRTGIYAVRCSPRVVVVGLLNQIYCFDSWSLQNTFSCVTYPSPPPGIGATTLSFGAVAVGPRWLAYAANQPLITSTGRVSPQHLTPSPGVSPSTSPANASLVHYAKESSKQIAAGIVTLGDIGYKTFRYCSDLLPDGAGAPQSGNSSFKTNSNGHSAWQGAAPPEPPEYAGTVIIRDLVSKTIVAQFRAHTSPLFALVFDPSGTLLVTASVYGHNINVYRLTPVATGNGVATSVLDANVSFVHLYKLYRGITKAVIQDVSFSSNSQWIAVSSSRGTSHVYAISPFGGTVGIHTHGTSPPDGLTGLALMQAPAFPWWSSTGSVRVCQQTWPPPPQAMTLSVVSRIKNGIGGWRGTVTGAAAAATGRTSTSSVAVASTFHDGGGEILELEAGTRSLKEQLWVLSPSGHLIRYLLRPSVGIDSGYSGNVGASTMNIGSPGRSQELHLVIEPLEKWDVSRRPSWAEREERVESLSGQGVSYEHGNVDATGGQWSGATGLGLYGGNAGLGKEGMTIEELQRWFMSNAEVQMHNHARPMPTPTWAKHKVSFHVMLPKDLETDRNANSDSVGGEIEIERFPTRVIEVRKKDLVPVFERIQVFNKVQGAREIMASESLPVAGLQLQHSDNGLRDEPTGSVLGGGIPIHRTSSGSSFGSEGVPGGALNGYHHNYQDYPEISVAGTPPSSYESSPSFYHQSTQSGAPLVFGRHAKQGTLLSPKRVSVDYFHSNFNIHAGHTTSEPVSSVMDSATLDGSQHREGEISGRYVTRPIRHGEVHIPISYDGCLLSSVDRAVGVPLEGVKDAGLDASSDTKNVDLEENVANVSVHTESGETGLPSFRQMIHVEDELQHCEVKSLLAHNSWDGIMTKQGVSPLVKLASGGKSIQHLDDAGSGFLFSHDDNEVTPEEGALSHETPVGGISEDADSMDAHSKSEDNEGGDHGNDWEGTMFPPFDDEEEN